jgi:hypothetical protein
MMIIVAPRAQRNQIGGVMATTRRLVLDVMGFQTRR